MFDKGLNTPLDLQKVYFDNAVARISFLFQAMYSMAFKVEFEYAQFGII